VVEAAVVGVPDDTKGTVPIAFVTLAAGVDPAAVREQIGEHIAKEMGGYARPASIHVTPVLPKTRTGKTMRRLLRDLLVHGRPTGDISAMEDPAVLEVLAGVVADAAAGERG
jgi:acetyl-CoA synthetase